MTGVFVGAGLKPAPTNQRSCIPVIFRQPPLRCLLVSRARTAGLFGSAARSIARRSCSSSVSTFLGAHAAAQRLHEIHDVGGLSGFRTFDQLAFLLLLKQILQ